METCPICEKHKTLKKEEIILETEDWIVTHGPVESQILGYLYLEPKKHVENWSEFDPRTLSTMGPIIKTLEERMKKIIELERLYAVTISEAVRHLHVHLIPRVKQGNIRGVNLIELATQNFKGKKLIKTKHIREFVNNIRLLS